MEDLQLVLFVLGAIAIIAVLLHGVWSIKKDNKAKAGLRDGSSASFNQKGDKRDRDGFDDFGLGPVVVKGQDENQTPESTLTNTTVLDENLNAYEAQDGAIATDEFDLSHEPSEKRRQEPVIRQMVTSDAEDIEQMPLDLDNGQAQNVAPEFAHSHGHNEVKSTDATVQQLEPEEEPLGEPQDVLALHLVARDGQTLQGAELLPCLLALNFKFGDMSIFHRHQDNAGTGKVIFSMANMVKPGVFDPDTMEQFTTPGVVLFLTLPCYGDALMNFSNMLNSVQQLADDLDALVLDGKRQSWTETAKFEYVQRIKSLKL